MRNKNKTNSIAKNHVKWKYLKLKYHGWKRFFATLSILFSVISIMSILLLVSITLSLPKDLTMVEGEEYHYMISSRYFRDSIKANTEKYGINVNIANNPSLSLDLNNSADLLADDIGKYEVQMSLFNIIPVKKIEVEVIPQKEIMACGNAVGVKIEDNWVTVIDLDFFYDTNNIKSSPAKKSGIMINDRITKINGIPIDDVEKVSEIIKNSQGNKLSVTVERNGNELKFEVEPKLDRETNNYKLGVWIRDGMTGIGTLTFYNKENDRFMALGHSISETETELAVDSGKSSIVKANIIGVKKGESGNPGELIGSFGKNELGNITCDTKVGIMGKFYKNMKEAINNYPVKIASGINTKEGQAYILSNLDGDKIEKFAIEIKKLNKWSRNSNKDMIIQVVDSDLINRTGGIVQGMSGSPIIQNDTLIGAVTHVFVNDPRRGYGVFIDKMLKTMTDVEERYAS